MSGRWTMLDWFHDQERRLEAWRDEAASRGADAEELEMLSRQREWLSAQVRRLSDLAPHSLNRPVRIALRAESAAGVMRHGH